ncbi:MAG: hypothetical protein IBX62_04150 [Coriobacteriia bacterium]|nr:hypothetical protein [Coriobacteriia bacterium]
MPEDVPRPLTVLEVTVTGQRAEALVEVRPDAARTGAFPSFTANLLLALPGLASHECHNGRGRTFIEELRDTETAHAFEHVALQLMRLAGSPATGETTWDFQRDGRGRYRVALRFEDDLLCFGALRLAEQVIAAAAGEGEMHVLVDEVARLRGLAGQG